MLKIGPVKATFAGEVKLRDKVYPESYAIVGEGKGGIAGFAKGGAKVKLTPEDDGTLLTYDVDAQVGGKIAQLGSRLIASTSRKLADQFFKKFADVAAEQAASSPPARGRRILQRAFRRRSRPGRGCGLGRALAEDDHAEHFVLGRHRPCRAVPTTWPFFITQTGRQDRTRRGCRG